MRVSDMEKVSFDAARDTTDVRAALFVDVRGDALRVVFLRLCVLDVRSRGTNAVARAAVLRFTVVAVRAWDCVVVLLLFVRETGVPSRTAPQAMPMQTNIFAAKNRIFFISGTEFSKNLFFAASEYFINFSCCKRCKNNIICRLPVRIWRNW